MWLDGEELVEELDRDGAFAHRGRDPLDRAVPHVTGGEHARHARLEEERTAVERPDLAVGHVRARSG